MKEHLFGDTLKFSPASIWLLLQKDDENHPSPRSEANPSDPSKNFNVKKAVQNMVSGGIAGSAFAYSSFPIESFSRLRMIHKRKFSHLYRGFSLYYLNLVPAVTAQFVMYGLLGNSVSSNDSFMGNVVKSTLPGILSAPVATMAENITASKIKGVKLSEYPFRLFRSLPQVAIRDGIFTACMFSVIPEAIKYTTENYGAYTAFPSILAFSYLGAVVSQPFDRVAAALQFSEKKTTGVEVVKELFKREGVKAFFRVPISRMGLFGCAAYGLPKIRDAVAEKLFEPHSTVNYRK